ncbi:uncharacterized protein B0J16DRAFT_331195 [Fusarium flagelliforme]|uniref:uncharacterized protein n=1 Tax=Fusarium flagelliforme TaxID=2675880 RepID=UPI001E8E90F9|nr:uncharacterized protein B0J16DRAFT_331195 [Fusarium flagelliforme]KAH7198828.1 hypothetical protein B0J16DRAFT_331195 [Fusarium flagelliforme]
MLLNLAWLLCCRSRDTVPAIYSINSCIKKGEARFPRSPKEVSSSIAAIGRAAIVRIGSYDPILYRVYLAPIASPLDPA